LKKNKPTLIVITGPTAIGKTSVAVKVAQSYNTEIISADSRQIYKELDIGVAKPDSESLAKVKHHFISEISINEPYSVANYEKEAIERIVAIMKDQEHVVLTGGTGLYIKAILEGLDPLPSSNPEIEKKWSQKLKDEGIAPLQNALRIADPNYANQVDLDNPRRIIRALTVFDMTGQPFSSFLEEKKIDRPFNPVVISLHMDRPLLYERINLRVDQMMEQGLLQEVESLRPHWGLRSMQTVGYQEFYPYFNGEITLDQAIEKVKQHSRNYAKRQITWCKNQLQGIEMEPNEFLHSYHKLISAI